MEKTFKRGNCNNGSTTVEMCFVMPIVFIVIVLCIGFLVNSSVDMKAQQMAYSTIYTYDVDMDSRGINMENKLKLYTEKGFIKAEPEGIKGILGYNNQIVLYCTEYNKCTERLRRWQAYGDIFQE